MTAPLSPVEALPTLWEDSPDRVHALEARLRLACKLLAAYNNGKGNPYAYSGDPETTALLVRLKSEELI